MDLTRLTRGEKIASISGILLILIMFIFDWYGPSGATSLGGTNAWETYSLIDLILFITAVGAIGIAVLSANRQQLNLPVAASAIVTGLGILSILLILFRIVDTPSYDVLGVHIDTDTKIGVWLGLIATIALTYGSYVAMQEEGAALGAAPRDRGSTPPPPPPPPSSPPPPPSQ